MPSHSEMGMRFVLAAVESGMGAVMSWLHKVAAGIGLALEAGRRAACLGRIVDQELDSWVANTHKEVAEKQEEMQVDHMAAERQAVEVRLEEQIAAAR